MSKYPVLESPLKIGNMEIRNRIAMPPMGTKSTTMAGYVTEEGIRYFEERAKGGVGLIVTECTDVDKNRRYHDWGAGLFEDSQVPEWSKLAAAIHKHGAKCVMQLFHPGPLQLWDYNGLEPISASRVPHAFSSDIYPREITREEIEDIIIKYGEAARRAVEAGYDAVEIHMAHNHGLLGTFLSPLHNKRSDEFGGDLDGRMTVPLAVIRKVREVVGPDFTLGVRLSATLAGGDSNYTIYDTCRVAQMVEAAGINYIHLSNGTQIDNRNVMPPQGMPTGLNADYAAKIKEYVNIPVGVVGRITDPDTAEMILESGKADFVYLGRAHISDPKFANKSFSGREKEIRPCIGCLRCRFRPKGLACCTMNPEYRRETEGGVQPADKKKKVLVVGGGPGGIQAATTLAQRGHDVTLVDKGNELGGQMILAAYPPTKQETAIGLKFLIEECKRAGANIVTNVNVTKEFVQEFAPDEVVLATGSNVVMPKWITESGHPNVLPYTDALMGYGKIGKNVVIIGGGFIGCEVADHLAFLGDPHNYQQSGARKVSIIEMKDALAVDDETPARGQLIKRLRYRGVRMLTNSVVDKIDGDTIFYTVDGEEHCKLKHVDTIVVSVGRSVENSLEKDLEGLNIPVHVIGDAKEPRSILFAIREAWELCRTL